MDARLDMYDPPFFVIANTMRTQAAEKTKASYQGPCLKHLENLLREGMKQYEKSETAQLSSAAKAAELPQDASKPAAESES